MANKEDLKYVIEKLEKIEEKVNRISGKKERQRQYMLLLFSLIAASLTSLVISAIIELLKSLGYTGVDFYSTIIYLSIYVLVTLIFLVREVYDIGDYVIKCEFEESKFRELFDDILNDKIVKISTFERKRIVRVRMKGLQTFVYLTKRITESYDEKVKYLKSNFKEVKRIGWDLRKKDKGNIFSEIILLISNKKGKLRIDLDSKHFSPQEAEAVSDKIKTYERKGILKITSKDGF